MIAEVYRRFPTDDAYLAYIERLRQKGLPVCPYGSTT